MTSSVRFVVHVSQKYPTRVLNQRPVARIQTPHSLHVLFILRIILQIAAHVKPHRAAVAPPPQASTAPLGERV